MGLFHAIDFARRHQFDVDAPCSKRSRGFEQIPGPLDADVVLGLVSPAPTR
jgi:hypothetical protein